MFEFNSTSYNEFIRDYRNDNRNRLMVFAGTFDENRKYAIDQIRRETFGEIVEIDLSKVITQFEDESFEHIDRVIDGVAKDAELVIFKNAQQLSGVYTGFTLSSVKYATPQEKYFLNAIKKLDCSVLLEFHSVDQLDQTLLRIADVVVSFKNPSSLIERIVWWAKSIRVNGSNLPSPRPH